MTISSDKAKQAVPRDVASWAQPISKLSVVDVPTGAINLNVAGRQVVSPLQGFGPLWVKTFRVRLTGLEMTPAEVMEVWKANFPHFQPAENHFYPSMAGIQPGEVVFIDATVPAFRGLPSLLPVATGVMVLYADEHSFTVMTPEGHPESGWNTFSTYEEDGYTVAQIQTMTRTTDPIYEIWHRYLGSSEQQDKTWTHVLTALAAHLGVQAEVQAHKVCLDPTLQWKEAKNLWYNAGVRTVFYYLGTPIRWIRRRR
ncbi:MAG: hypothetical protein M3220_00875 [Chloroflexota bacterium]|nr:hypothetical protein [Chloroflexota bacterium]